MWIFSFRLYFFQHHLTKCFICHHGSLSVLLLTKKFVVLNVLAIYTSLFTVPIWRQQPERLDIPSSEVQFKFQIRVQYMVCFSHSWVQELRDGSGSSSSSY